MKDKTSIKETGVIRLANPDLLKDEAGKTIDSILAGKKSLKINFDYSHSGKLINRRIYSVKGQKRVASTLIDKAINKNHSDDADHIIGRITKADYQLLANEAKQFAAKARVSEDKINDLIVALDKLDYEKAADLYHSTKLLKMRGWKGVGKVTVEGRVTDENAIEKFLDRRYLNFSAEQMPQARICSVCLKDAWGGECEHSPGVSYDGKLAFHLIGDMDGIGAAVVMHPGDSDSVLTSLTMDSSYDDESEMEIPNIISATIAIEDKETLAEGEKKVFLSAATSEATIDDTIKELEDVAKEEEVVNDIATESVEAKEEMVVAAAIDASEAIIKELKDSLLEKDTIIDSLNKTIVEKDAQIKETQDRAATTINTFKDKHSSVLNLAKKLKDQEQKFLDRANQLLSILDQEIEGDLSFDAIESALNKVNTDKLKNFMASGLTRENVKEVETPIIENHNDNSPNKTELNETGHDAYEESIRNKYKDRLTQQGKVSADAWLASVRRTGVLSKNFKI